MSAVQYVGPAFGGNGEVLSTATATTMATNASSPVALPTQAYVNQLIVANTTNPSNPALTTLTQAQVNTALGPYPTVGQVNTADATYFARASLGAPSGLATLSAGATQVVSSQINVARANDRVMRTYTLAKYGTVNFTGTIASTAGALRDQSLATITIPDPGYPWVPLPFATVWGYAQATTGATPLADPAQQTDTFGLLVVMLDSSTDTTSYASGATSASWQTRRTRVLPMSGVPPNVTVSARSPAYVGGATLTLYGSRWLGAGSYQFSDQNLDYYVIAAPAA